MTEPEVARYALRTFKLSSGGFPIRSIGVRGIHWFNGTCAARCINNINGLPRPGVKHESPSETCHCGVYGALAWDVLWHQFHQQAKDIVAVIAAEGQTIIGNRGLRTQFARVVAYWVSSYGSVALGENLKDATRYADLDMLLADYGIPMKSPYGVGVGRGTYYWNRKEEG